MRGDAHILQSKIDADAGELEGYNVYSIVKETGIDDEGLNEVRIIALFGNEYTILLLSQVYSSFLLLLQFATEYFPHPTFKDQNLIFYNALGSGKLSIGFNPIAIFNWIRNSMKMFKELGVKSYNMKGEIR